MFFLLQHVTDLSGRETLVRITGMYEFFLHILFLMLLVIKFSYYMF